MVALIKTVAYSGIETKTVTVQVHISSGLPAFTIVGLPDKAVAESRERVRSALNAMGLALPPKRITVNLAPADLQKEGSHFDLPIAAGLMVAQDILPAEELENYLVLGELGLDARIAPVAGVLPAAMAANAGELGLICPAAQGSEALWAGGRDIVAAQSLLQLVNHFKGTQIISEPQQTGDINYPAVEDMADIRGQETAKRALEIAAAGGHNLLMVGPPGAGKSMLAARLPGILPPMSPAEALETSIIHSVAGNLNDRDLVRIRPYRDPHHSASTPALVGGGNKARPGEISLAHNGVLFLDELPEFSKNTLESLRQPLETGSVSIARARQHVVYPARFQLIAAMNPCRCGHLGNPQLQCAKVPKCAIDYQNKLSGPLLDRIDMHIDVPAVAPWEMNGAKTGDNSQTIRARVIAARNFATQRLLSHGADPERIRNNAALSGDLLDKLARPDESGQTMLVDAAKKLHLSARSYHRIMRVARTIADMEQSPEVGRKHIGEALSYRRMLPGRHVGG